jgi:GntR family transcriptional regulator
MSMPIQLSVDTTSEIPAYRQIVDQLRVLITEQHVAPGATLPPVRALARELSVHHNTVAEAYRTLQQEGLLDIRHGRGACVLTPIGTPTVPRKESAEVLRRRLREVIAEFRSRGLSSRQIARELRGLSEALDA